MLCPENGPGRSGSQWMGTADGAEPATASGEAWPGEFIAPGMGYLLGVFVQNGENPWIIMVCLFRNFRGKSMDRENPWRIHGS